MIAILNLSELRHSFIFDVLDRHSIPKIWFYPLRFQFVIFLLAIVLSLMAVMATPGKAQDDNPEPIQEFTTKLDYNNSTIKIYEELNTDLKESQSLGPHGFCSLATVGAVHQNQACTCKIQVRVGEPLPMWTLRVQLDTSVKGRCRCQAICID